MEAPPFAAERRPEYEDYVYDQWEHGRFSDAAMVHMSSWYDPYPRTATDNYIGLSKCKKGPVRLILGPWTHGDRSRSWAGEVDFGKEATIDGNLAADFWQLRLRWFDRFLKGETNGVEHEPAVRIFVMGGGSGRRNVAGRMEHGGHWRTEADWPPRAPSRRPITCRNAAGKCQRPASLPSPMTSIPAIRCPRSAATSLRASR